MDKTSLSFDLITKEAKKIFQDKLNSYGCSWRVFRIESLTDQIFIKISRARSIQEKKIQKIKDETLKDDFIAILNYSLIGLIQLEKGSDIHLDMDPKEALVCYESQVGEAKNLMKSKNHDYDEAWKLMSLGSLTDMILQKIFRLKHIGEHEKDPILLVQKTKEQYIDIVNYAIFFLIRIQEK